MCCDEEILVGGLEHFVFFHILGIIIPLDFHIFSGVLKPPTSLSDRRPGRPMVRWFAGATAVKVATAVVLQSS